MKSMAGSSSIRNGLKASVPVDIAEKPYESGFLSGGAGFHPAEPSRTEQETGNSTRGKSGEFDRDTFRKLAYGSYWQGGSAARILMDASDTIDRMDRELRAARAALVMIRGTVAGVLEDEQMVGGEFA
jgi:hypothetical protein